MLVGGSRVSSASPSCGSSRVMSIIWRRERTRWRSSKLPRRTFEPTVYPCLTGEESTCESVEDSVLAGSHDGAAGAGWPFPGRNEWYVHRPCFRCCHERSGVLVQRPDRARGSTGPGGRPGRSSDASPARG